MCLFGPPNFGPPGPSVGSARCLRRLDAVLPVERHDLPRRCAEALQRRGPLDQAHLRSVGVEGGGGVVRVLERRSIPPGAVGDLDIWMLDDFGV